MLRDEDVMQDVEDAEEPPVHPANDTPPIQVAVSGLVGEDLEGYHVIVELGADASGRIYLGESIAPAAPQQRVVIKLLDMIQVEVQEEQERLLQKVATLQQLHHPHILPLLSAGIYKNMPYVVMEYVGAESLYERVQGKADGEPMRQGEALRVLAQIGQALSYAHLQHVLHGHVTPQNVLFNTRDEVLVTDFHLQALLSAAQAGDTNTPEEAIYRAPEQAAGHTSEQSDQYKLGCIAYELLTGHKAFMIPSVSVPGKYYRTKTLVEPRQLNPALPWEMEEALLKATSREPAERYPDMPAFLAALGVASVEDEEQAQGPLILAQAVEGASVTPGPTIDAIEIVEVEHADPFGWASDPTLKVPTYKDKAAEARKAAALAASKERGWLSFDMLPYVAKGKPAVAGAGGKPKRAYRWVFALIGCLVIMALVIAIFMQAISLHVPSKTVVATPGATGVAQFPPSNGTTVPAPTIPVSLTPSSGRGHTPQGSGPGAKPTPQPTSGPTPQPTAGPTPQPTSGPTPQPPPPPKPVEVSLGSFFNNEGIGSWPGEANFDGSGYSYPATQLPAGGRITVSGVPYQFPGNGQGASDNVSAYGQTISVTPGKYHQVYLLAAASWGPVSGAFAIRYADGSTTTANITVADWLAGSSGGLRAPYRYGGPNGYDGNPVYIHVISITLDATRTATALILPWYQGGPYQNGRIHVFAVTLEP